MTEGPHEPIPDEADDGTGFELETVGGGTRRSVMIVLGIIALAVVVIAAKVLLG